MANNERQPLLDGNENEIPNYQRAANHGPQQQADHQQHRGQANELWFTTKTLCLMIFLIMIILVVLASLQLAQLLVTTINSSASHSCNCTNFTYTCDCNCTCTSTPWEEDNSSIPENITEIINFFREFADEQISYSQNNSRTVNEIRDLSVDSTQKLNNIVDTLDLLNNIINSLALLQANSNSIADAVNDIVSDVESVRITVEEILRIHHNNTTCNSAQSVLCINVVIVLNLLVYVVLVHGN